MATIWDETKVQTAKMKDRPLKEKLEYFWEYYKIQTGLVAIGLFFLISIIHAVVTSKDYGLSIVLVNAVAPDYEENYSDWVEDLTNILEINPKKYEVVVDGSMTVGLKTTTANVEYSSQQKFAALMSSKSMDIVVANTPVYEQYAQNEYFYDLRDLLPQDEYAKLEADDLIYYTDAATFVDYEENVNIDISEKQAAYTVNHSDPTSIKSPIPVGIIMTNVPSIADKQIYVWLAGESDYQGYPQEAILGVPINTPRTDAAIKCIEYLLAE